MPWLDRHGDGWRVVWREAGRGSPLVKSEVFPTKGAANAEMQARAALLASRKRSTRAVVPWDQVRHRWLLFLKDQGRTAAYIAQAKAVLERSTASWRTSADATPASMAALKIGPWRLAKACLRWSRVYLGQQVDDGAIGRRPHRAVSRPTPDLLSDAQVADLVAKAGRLGGLSGQLLAHLVSTYGHRPQSLAMLRVESVELGATPRLTLPVKSGDTIRHPVLPETAALLAQAIGKRKTGPLLLDPLGKVWTSGAKASTWFWHQVGTDTDEPDKTKRKPAIGIYQLKSYAISRMLDLKLDLKTIASITGHRTPAVLLRYARTNETRQLAALSALAKNRVTEKCAPQVLPKKS